MRCPFKNRTMEVMTMKWKKLLALALAGVMALALLTGCSGSGGKSEDRTIAENVGSYTKAIYPGVEISYDVPELTKTIRPDFDPDSWCKKNSTYFTDEKIAFLRETLKAYEQCNVTFVAFDSTDYSAFTQSLILSSRQASDESWRSTYFFAENAPARAPDYVNIAVCHKTVNGREYCLAIAVISWKETSRL